MVDTSLHVQSQGEGPELVLVHGWGLNADVWEELAARLAESYRVTVVDLPGHGRSPLIPGGYTLEALAKALAEALPQGATWVGWSLGGLICQAVALAHPASVERLILVCSSPRFVRGTEWHCGIDPGLLTQFGWDLATDFRGTLLRFLSLEARGSEHAREELRALRERIFRHGEPAMEAVQGGLRLLGGSDLRASLNAMGCPVRMILGERDQLVPATTLGAVRALCDRVEGAVIQGAAHAPFLSHRSLFTRQLEEYLPQ
ncbi:MAG: pimeloyl-ACP methyl ester esterase BioH [Gammaproteobacteria bacterium]